MSPLLQALRAAPVTATLLLLSLLGFLLIELRAPVAWVSAFSFEPFRLLAAGRMQFGEAGGQYWRWITPVFLHFGWLHVVFNSLWTWEFGHRIERWLGSGTLLLLFLVVALLSNYAQAVFGGPALFGGMSGVVYGLLGFNWVVARLYRPWALLAPPPGIMWFMLGWLLLCLLGVVEVLGFGAVANAAHVGGLLAGGSLGLLAALAARLRAAKG
jgi:GlpG protein